MAGKTDVIVIGGGAAGMAAAIACARQNKKVTILEHNEKLGRKLSATGNGKCNYTNRLQNMDCYRGTDKEVIEAIISQFGVEDTLSFFRGLGIYPKEKNGYYYPHSEQASSVIEAMRLELEHLKVKVKCKEHIIGIKRLQASKDSLLMEGQKEEFLVSTETYTYRAPKVILAAGGLAASKLGSDGSGYELAKALGLNVTELYPALTGLKTREDFSPLAGVRVKAAIELHTEDREGSLEWYREMGELQLVSYGISGIPVFQISRFAAVSLAKGGKVTAKIDFLPELSKEELAAILKKLREQTGYKTAGTFFNGMLDNKLTAVLLKKSRIDKNKKAEELSEEELLEFCHYIKEFTCTITDTNGFENAQVTAGGVSLLEISPETMESKKIKGLYLAGELLDADGICGGYNLQWAWATGYLAGRACGRETETRQKERNRK